MPDPTYNGDLQASTLDDMLADAAYDNFFVKTAYQQHMRAIGAIDPFGGGVLMREPFIMGSPQAGAAAPGSNFDIEHVQQLADLAFTPRLYTSRDMLETFSLSVQNKGPNARIKLKDMYYRNAIASISTNVEVACYHHGQTAIAGQISDDGSLRINGTVADWESWVGMPFPESGDYVFPEGLATVHIDREADLGSYWEPNVWMIHPEV